MLSHLFKKRRTICPEIATLGGGGQRVEGQAADSVKPIEQVAERLQAASNFVEPGVPKINRAPVVTGKNQGPNHVRIKFDQQILHQNDRIGIALGNLATVLGQQAVMHPVLNERLLVIAFALGKFVFVVWEDEVKPASVNVKTGPEKPHAHGRTFNVPAWPTGPELALPGGLAGL